MYEVFDTQGYFIRSFPTYKEAYSFLIMNQRYDWSIVR